MKSASVWSPEGSSADRLRGLLSRSRTDTLDGDITIVTGSFRYDDELRLIESVIDSGGLFGADTETFTLDPVGNRTAHSEVLGEWSYNANNQLTDKGILLDATGYEYDPAGNLIRKTEIGRTTHYRYDARNRLIEVKDGSGNPIARYGYDPFDRRIWKEQYRDKDGNSLSPAKRSYYFYADEGLIAEAEQAISLPPLPPGEGWGEGISASTPPVLVAQYGPKPDSEFTTGTLFVKTRNSTGQDSVGYYQHDHLQTPIQATDKTGRVIWSAQYNVFGRATASTPTADKPTIRSDLRLPGQVEDEETGLHYNWHRYYDPIIGRYVTADPIGLEGGINLYAYVENNPVNGFDPNGLKEISIRWPRPQVVFPLANTDPKAPSKKLSVPGDRDWGRPNGRGRYDCVVKCDGVEISGPGQGKGNSGCCPDWIYGWGFGTTPDEAWNNAWDAADANSPAGCQKRHCRGIAGSCKNRKGGKAK